jgi:ADP-heptose:LPS heptosyltransferase
LVSKGYTVFFTGTTAEGDLFRLELPKNPAIIDTTGKMSLAQMIYFISEVKNLVACSTGPLHIAGFTGIRTIGLFSPRRPIHPGRWKPLGEKVSVLVNNPDCPVCKKKKPCLCIQEISVERVLNEIE